MQKDLVIKVDDANCPTSPIKDQITNNSLNDYLKNVERELQEHKDLINVSGTNNESDSLSSSQKDNNLDLVIYDEMIAVHNSSLVTDSMLHKKLELVVSNSSSFKEEVSLLSGKELCVENNSCALNFTSFSGNEVNSLENVDVSNDLEEGELDSGAVSETELLVGKNKIWHSVYNTRGKNKKVKDFNKGKAIAKSNSFHK
ncbi:hypothetical protein IEQ34_007636 [Dendrobium chrysotoxum]|uniref:Uncharacterized protein n=1 Tax=Dendrobium chrysotoxum TaxID=161865 RepID=A0AAV7H5H6_DENCH|nr:hypothetical protein IEQ34_007636 [Dendrobium chrysotoxum]